MSATAPTESSAAVDSSYGRITPEGVAKVRARIGRRWPIREPHLRCVTIDSIRHVALGIGDLNPRWHERPEGEDSRLPAPPALLYGVGWGSRDMRRGEGLPGVHGLHAGDAWTYLRPLVEGDEVHGAVELTSLNEREGSYAGRSLMQTRRITFFDRAGEVVAWCDMSAVRAERQQGRSRGKYQGVKAGTYSQEEIERIDKEYDAERVRGVEPRLWESVAVGDAIDPVVKGPLRVADMVAWVSAVGSPHIRVGQDWLAYRRRSPAIGVLDPRSGVPDTVERVHWDDFMASEIGMPAPYDYGAQRGAFATHMLTNWCGDAGFLAALDVQYRGMVFLRDTLRFTGVVDGRWIGSRTGTGFVSCVVEGHSQRGDRVLVGRAVVALPRDNGEPLGLPIVATELGESPETV